ncbi:hypothetical protein CHS0354_006220 [Potamilus streckersoni]|uniref:Uncharacterized protein n=1 Tax=Potamilus streckersoni TaxID=2493646 RepID=A0AAE0SRG2_9BIVA|nr:hypothetical protein CHS0354_006220 [Potamilus streckersoni]
MGVVSQLLGKYGERVRRGVSPVRQGSSLQSVGLSEYLFWRPLKIATICVVTRLISLDEIHLLSDTKNLPARTIDGVEYERALVPYDQQVMHPAGSSANMQVAEAETTSLPSELGGQSEEPPIMHFHSRPVNLTLPFVCH